MNKLGKTRALYWLPGRYSTVKLPGTVKTHEAALSHNMHVDNKFLLPLSYS